MYGDIDSEDQSFSFCENCSNCNNCDSGYKKTFRKTCGNTDVLQDIEHPYCESGPDDQQWLVDTDHVFVEGDLEHTVDEKVYH